MLFIWLCFFVISIQGRTIQNKFTAGDISTALNEIAAIDENGGGEDEVIVNWQNMASTHYFSHDNAPLPLFTSVSSRIKSGATFKALEDLQGLYTNPDVYSPDENSAERISAANLFIDTVFSTNVLQTAWNFLKTFGLSPSDEVSFKKQLFDLWFGAFNRSSSAQGSSGFESVFVGEVDGSEVVGLSNWYRYYLLEQESLVNYHGWFTRQKGVQLELQFEWSTKEAMFDSFLIGTSPEFEVAAYTICGLAYIGTCNYVKNGQGIVLAVEVNDIGGAKRIQSVYPSIDSGVQTTKSATTKGTTAIIVEGDLQSTINSMRAADVDQPVDYTLDWGKPRSGSTDVSAGPLITYMNEDIFQRAQYKALIDLYNAEIFVPDVCVAEASISGFKKTYIEALFNLWTNSTIFQYAYDYLKSVGAASSDWSVFRQKLWVLWFGVYSRCSGTLGSSGFEHVFIGEWKSTTVDGQHCWVKYYLLEKAGLINYHGYISYDDQLTGTFQYKWEKYIKNIGGFNFGTSPGFDFAVFSICALTKTGSNACKFTLDGYPIWVTSYTQSCNEGTCLSTAYPANS